MNREKATSLNDMRDMLATLPEFQEMRDQFSLHLNLAEKCMEVFGQKKLLEIGLVEQVRLRFGPADRRAVQPAQLLKANIPRLFSKN
jgi:syntaxin-binding protein 1